MPQYETFLTLQSPIAQVFDFFSRPVNLLKISPPDLNLRLIEAPDCLQLGSRITVEGRRWGIPQKITSEVTGFEVAAYIIDEQRQGPFKKWKQAHRFEVIAASETKVSMQVEYEPPGGALGFVVTARAIDKDLRTVFAFRAEKLKEFLG